MPESNKLRNEEKDKDWRNDHEGLNGPESPQLGLPKSWSLSSDAANKNIV